MIKEKVDDYLLSMGNNKSGIVNPDRRHNAGPVLFELFVWQEACTVAEAQLKSAWVDARTSGVIMPDDALRDLSTGEHIVAESARFSCLVTLQSPRNTFDKEKFLDIASKRLKLPRIKLLSLMEEATRPSKAPLGKRVLEV